MSEQCSHDCASCGSDCPSRQAEKTDFREPSHELSNIKKVYAVISGKGGVGKSMVTSMLATLSRRAGKSVAIMDADITGPSIPKAFGITEKASGSDLGLFPVKSKTGISIMSINLLLDHDTDPVIWRGPVIAGVIKQFWSEVIYDDVDIMFIDMPPGTGDVPLTVFQTIPVDGAIIVTSPQELVGMIVEKAYNMAKMMHIPVVGIVENFSYLDCPDCAKRIYPFGQSDIEKTAQRLEIKTVVKLPIDPRIAAAADSGKIETFEGDWLNELSAQLDQ